MSTTPYEGEAGLALSRRYEMVSAPDLHGPVADLLPAAPSRVLDVGAGSGRDAAWLAKMGHAVTAVEPSATLRAEGARLHPCLGINWIADQMPDLAAVRALKTIYEVILLSAVWQHVAPADRLNTFRTLTGLLDPGGLMLISLRLGPPDEARGMHPVSVGEIRLLADETGLAVLREAPLADRLGRGEISWITTGLRLRT